LLRIEAKFEAERAAWKKERQELVSALDQMGNKVSHLETRLEAMDRAQRAPNVLIFGLAESPGDSVKQVKSLLAPMGAENVVSNILEAKRLGARRDPGARPRPLLVRFNNVDNKHALFKKSKELRAKRITLDDDLTPAQMEQRRTLRPEYTRLKDQGLKVFWRGERLLKVTAQGVVPHDAEPMATSA
jgi:uncharacterized protein YukE